MATIAHEDLWAHPGHPGIIVVTANATVKYSGALVMGRGAARQAKVRIPHIDQECGLAVQEAGANYGFLVIRQPTEQKVGFGIFQTKNCYWDPSTPQLIAQSVAVLRKYAGSHPDTQVRMNYPGIGCGGLDRGQVELLLDQLPDNVTVCYR